MLPRYAPGEMASPGQMLGHQKGLGAHRGPCWETRLGETRLRPRSESLVPNGIKTWRG